MKDRANQHPLHRAATTGSNAFLQLLLHPPEGRPKTRLNGSDRAGEPRMSSNGVFGMTGADQKETLHCTSPWSQAMAMRLLPSSRQEQTVNESVGDSRS